MSPARRYAPTGWPASIGMGGRLRRNPRHWGKGYATEGAKAALVHAFVAWQRNHVMSLVNPKNLPSIRVAERIGERLEGRIDHCGQQMLVYGLDRATYLAEVAAAGGLVRRAG